MIQCYLFPGVGSSGATSHCLHRTWLLWHKCSNAMHRRCVGLSGAEDPASKSPLLASTRPSDRPTLRLEPGVGHPVLKASSWRVSVLIQIERRIDRRYPHSDHRIIRCYRLHCSSSATRPTLLKIGPSVHPTVPRVSPCVPTRPTIAQTLAKLISSVHPTVSFLFLSCSVLTLVFLILACGFLASLGPRSVYKDMLKQYG
jgi:hypothetical protein